MAFADNDTLRGEDVFKAFLRSKGMIYTYERRLILHEIIKISKTNSHFSIENIFNNLIVERSRVSKGTLYKTLSLLENCNIVKKNGVSLGRYIYEKIGQHNIGHLVCLRCGEINDINQSTIENLIIQVCLQKKFKRKSHIFEIKGYCCNCLKG